MTYRYTIDNNKDLLVSNMIGNLKNSDLVEKVLTRLIREEVLRIFSNLLKTHMLMCFGEQ